MDRGDRLILAAVLTFLLLMHLWFQRTECFQFASKALHSNTKLSELLGENIDIYLPVFHSTYRLSGDGGEASMLFTVKGNKNRGEVRVDVYGKNNHWKILNATLFLSGGHTVQLH